MVREHQPIRSPLQPSQGRAHPQENNMDKQEAQRPESPPITKVQASLGDTSSPQPVFGRTTALGASPQPFARNQPPQRPANIGVQRQAGSQRDPYSNLFVHRPQLHKPAGGGNPLSQLNRPVHTSDSSQETSRRNVSSSAAGIPTVRSTLPGSKTLPQRDFDDDFFQIPKPPTWKPNAPSYPTFSSNRTTNAYIKPKSNFVDMGVQDHGFSANASLWEDRYTSTDPYDFMDTAKANEQLKALFEGGIEEEEDKPRTRQKKNRSEKKIDAITDKVKDLSVKSDTPGTAAGKGEDKANEDEPDNAEQEEGEDGEEEPDDGTREGLKVKLLPHQTEGVEWMRRKELGRKDGRGKTGGGILADDMGLGKTIQSIALIMSNPRSDLPTHSEGEQKSKPKFDKGTLVVAPLALIKQWEGEIKDRIDEDHALNVCVHHGAKRTKSFKELRKYDVVITTYSTLSSEHAASGENLPVGCFGVKWHRIILDEAHSVKNRNAKSTKAACGLQAQYRWCLTGTPMQNNLDELQSLIHFLRIAPLDKLDYWREHITRPMSSGRGGLAIKRLQAVLRNIMKRRTKDVLKQNGALNGDKTADAGASSSGFRLVKRTVESVEANFTERERSFYKRLESRADQKLEMMMAGNKLSYASALVLLMRLRQACNHPRLIGSDLANDKDNFAESGSQTPKKKAAQIQDDTDDLATMLGGLSVEMKLCDVCQVELSKSETQTGALRCAACEEDLAEQELLAKDQHVKKRDKKALMKSDRKINRRVIVDSDDEDDQENESTEASVGLSSTMDDEDEVNDETDEEEQESHTESEYKSDEVTVADLVSSTKIRRLLSILRADAHKHKYIVFSVFTSMLDLIEPFLQQSHIKFARYDGSMRNDLREASLDNLRHDPTVRVLLCSLRAGSLGLNLTAASRVVVLEPFWNPFVEEQAIDRVHRLNQTQDVVVYKLTIKDTVESRILQLQEKKRALAKATVEGHTASGVAKLSMAEMLKLFDHKAEHDARVDMVGMPDRNALLVDGESTEEVHPRRDDRYKDHQNDRDQERYRVKHHDHTIKKANDIYSRRW